METLEWKSVNGKNWRKWEENKNKQVTRRSVTGGYRVFIACFMYITYKWMQGGLPCPHLPTSALYSFGVIPWTPSMKDYLSPLRIHWVERVFSFFLITGGQKQHPQCQRWVEELSIWDQPPSGKRRKVHFLQPANVSSHRSQLEGRRVSKERRGKEFLPWLIFQLCFQLQNRLDRCEKINRGNKFGPGI